MSALVSATIVVDDVPPFQALIRKGLLNKYHVQFHPYECLYLCKRGLFPGPDERSPTRRHPTAPGQGIGIHALNYVCDELSV